MTPGQKIRELRIDEGMTQVELADLAGIDQASLSRTERDVSIPHPNHQEAIARALKTTVKALFE